MTLKETFIENFKFLYDVKLENDKTDNFNKKRKILYTKLPQNINTDTLLRYLYNHKMVTKVEKHINNYYWIFLKKV